MVGLILTFAGGLVALGDDGCGEDVAGGGEVPREVLRSPQPGVRSADELPVSDSPRSMQANRGSSQNGSGGSGGSRRDSNPITDARSGSGLPGDGDEFFD